MPRLPQTLTHVEFASAEGASEENFEFRQRTWSKSFKIALNYVHHKIAPIASAHEWRFFVAVMSGASKVRAKKIWKLGNRTSSKSFKSAVNYVHFKILPIVQAHEWLLFFSMSSTKTGPHSRAPLARARKIWNLDDRNWSKTFKNAVKLRAFRSCANRTSSQTVVFCRASRQNNPWCIATAKGAREENLGSTQRYLAKSLKLDVKLRAF